MTDITLTEFSKKISRLCRSEHGRCGTCENCPLFTYPCSPLEENFLEHIDEIVGIVCEWAEQHPQRKYNVRLMKYFDVEVAADNEDEAYSIAERILNNPNFNDGEDDYDIWITTV